MSHRRYKGPKHRGRGEFEAVLAARMQVGGSTRQAGSLGVRQPGSFAAALRHRLAARAVTGVCVESAPERQRGLADVFASDADLLVAVEQHADTYTPAAASASPAVQQSLPAAPTAAPPARPAAPPAQAVLQAAPPPAASDAIVVPRTLLWRTAASRLLGFASTVLRHFGAARGGARKLRVVESVSLGDKRFAAVLDIDGKRFLIGGGAGTVSLLTALEAAPASPNAQATGAPLS